MGKGWIRLDALHPIAIFRLTVSENSQYCNNEIFDFISGPWVVFMLAKHSFSMTFQWCFAIIFVGQMTFSQLLVIVVYAII
jgi:hypothetical protein